MKKMNKADKHDAKSKDNFVSFALHDQAFIQEEQDYEDGLLAEFTPAVKMWCRPGVSR